MRSPPRLAAVTSALIAGGALCLWADARLAARKGGKADRLPDEHATVSIVPNADLQRAKNAAEAANEAKTRYLVSVSHEIRSPLNAIYGYAQLLERDAISCAEAGAVIRRSAEHLTNLVESLLEISRIESGVIKIQSDVIDFRALLEQIVGMFRVQAAAKGLTLEVDVSERVPAQARTDEKRLRQILINLVSNAIKYTQAGGVTIKVSYRSQVADIAVHDTGLGIAADEIERVFEPFERGRSPEAQLQPGIGLGLAITRVLARVMGGDIAVTSAIGVGSTFRLRLMLPAPMTLADTAPEISRIEGYHGDRRTVLIVDDDPAQIAILQSLLQPLGFVVHAASSGAAGIELAARYAADLVLLDVQMPGLNGWETAAQLRANHGAELKIVMVSANAHDMLDRSDDDRSHDAAMLKPTDLDALLAVIGRQIGMRWITASVPERIVREPAHSPLPAEASPFLDRLRHSAAIGHVRGVESGLRDLRDSFPVAAGLASRLDRHLADFDLRSLVKTLDDADR